MGPFQAILSGAITLSFYAIVVAAVWRMFQMASDLGEIKKILADIRRNTSTPEPAVRPAAPVPLVAPPAAAGPISLESAEALLREVAAESQARAAEPSKTTA